MTGIFIRQGISGFSGFCGCQVTWLKWFLWISLNKRALYFTSKTVRRVNLHGAIGCYVRRAYELFFFSLPQLAFVVICGHVWIDWTWKVSCLRLFLQKELLLEETALSVCSLIKAQICWQFYDRTLALVWFGGLVSSVPVVSFPPSFCNNCLLYQEQLPYCLLDLWFL